MRRALLAIGLVALAILFTASLSACASSPPKKQTPVYIGTIEKTVYHEGNGLGGGALWKANIKLDNGKTKIFKAWNRQSDFDVTYSKGDRVKIVTKYPDGIGFHEIHKLPAMPKPSQATVTVFVTPSRSS